jgi:trimethylguanosine synthase
MAFAVFICSNIAYRLAGVGGNAIQFAMTCERVIAIDNSAEKIEMAKHNARIYGVEDRIEFIVGDFLKVAPGLKVLVWNDRLTL